MMLGHSQPVVAGRTLPPPPDSAFAVFAGSALQSEIVGLANGLAQMPSWSAIADGLLIFADDGVRGAPPSFTRREKAFRISAYLTAVLEILQFGQIDSFETAAVATLARHVEWRSTAVAWLWPQPMDLWLGWLAEHPGYRRLLALTLPTNAPMPIQLFGALQEGTC